VTQSWRRKVERAEHHLGDLRARVAPVEERRVYPVTERLEPHDEGEAYVHRVRIPQPDDSLLPIVAGELMFNLRSALDHLAVALVPESQRSTKTAFPIFTDDLDEVEPTTGKHLHPDGRARWSRMTDGFPEGAMPIVEMVQPYKHGRVGNDPKNVSLARLSAYQNADKHRHLMIVTSGVWPFTASFLAPDGRRKAIGHDPVPKGFMVGDGAMVGTTSAPLGPEVKVEAEGTLKVQIGDGRSGDYLPCIEVFEAMITDVAGIFPMLEPFLPS
jgi:hypothetical protein